MLPYCFAVVLAWAGDPVPTTPWLFDEVILKNTAKFRGLILKESVAGIEFQVVHQKRGRPTLTSTTFFATREIVQVKRLLDPERATLREKIAELDPHGVGEKQRMESLELVTVEWRGKAGGAKRYDSDHFSLTASTSDEITRRAAVRLEQIYAAFERVLPPRHQAARPTTVILAGLMEDYTALVGPVKNPSIYDPATNRIVCGSHLRQLGEDLTVAQAHHTREFARLKLYESDINQLYKGQPAELERFLGLVKRERQRLIDTRKANSLKFDQATRRLFAVLYHEAFHSYTATFVYPPLSAEEVRAGKGTGELPRWLNEGLGQLFESALVEAGELRVELPDAERLTKVQELLTPKAGKVSGLFPLADLLRARKETFLAEHASQLAVADRAYLTAWGVAYYLTFEKRIVGSKDLDKYLIALNTGEDPVKAFEAWIDQPIVSFEKELTDYLTRLQPTGVLLPSEGIGEVTMPKFSPAYPLELLLKLLDEGFDRKAWHGPNLRGALRRVDAAAAAWRPGPDRKNIWEHALHAAYWKYAIGRRMFGGERGSFALTGTNWFERPLDGDASEKAWKTDLKLLDESHAALREAVENLTPDDLTVIPPGCKLTNAESIYSIAMHDVYHAGQVQLIKRLFAGDSSA